MKKTWFISVLILMLQAVFVFGQSVPQGMKYQAVARNDKGEILANQEINLRIRLSGDNPGASGTYFTENHKVTTNQLGLFTLVLGEGNDKKGAFGEIPWSEEDIWMEVSISERGNSNFSVVSSSRLLAVPYAFHAATASQLVGANAENNNTETGSPGNNWILFGNSGTDASKDKLGTSDLVDLVIVTNNIERIRVLSNGDVNLANSLSIGKELNVDGNVFLNTLEGATIVYGPLTVERKSPTILSGILSVDLATTLNSALTVHGITNLNSLLNVNFLSPTKLTGTLQVDGITNLNSALNVNNMSPTRLSGTLLVQKNAVFNEQVLIDNAALQSEGVNSGALVVKGGTGIGGNLNVGGSSAFGGPVAFAGAVNISDQTESISKETGALIVGGGVGIGKRLNVGGATNLGNTLNVADATALAKTLVVTGASTLSSTLGVTGATTLGSTLGVTGATSLANTLGIVGVTTSTNTTEATSISTGALVVNGGAGIAKNLWVGGTLNVAGTTNMNGGLNVVKSAAGADVATFENTGNGNGISIKVANATPGIANNFVTFKNSSGSAVGRIEGETVAELENNPDYKSTLVNMDLTIATVAVSTLLAGFEVAQAGVNLAASLSSSTACVGFGACITAPIPSFIIAAGTNLALKIANTVNWGITLGQVSAARVNYVNGKKGSIGVTYQSGAGDYAEWLPKADKSEKFLPGTIVGVKNGTITRNTSDVSQLLVISTKPFMLGNMPAEGKEADYEKVAFMGQVPVMVAGKVKIGDYILPSGHHNGIGVAKSPIQMETEDFGKIIGVAWSETNELFSEVNVAIGLNAHDIASVVKKQDELIKKQDEKIEQLFAALKETNSSLSKLIPGFGEAQGTEVLMPEAAINPQKSLPGTTQNQQPKMRTDMSGKIQAIQHHENDIVYYDVSRKEIETMFDKAEQLCKESGANLSADLFWQKFNSDPAFKNEMINEMDKKFRKAVHFHKEINHDASR